MSLGFSILDRFPLCSVVATKPFSYSPLDLHTLSPLCAQWPRYYLFPFVCLAYVLLLSTLTPFCLPACLPFPISSLLSRLFFTLRTPSLFFLFPLALSNTFHLFLFSSSLSHSHSSSATALIQPTLTLSSLHHTPTHPRNTSASRCVCLHNPK